MILTIHVFDSSLSPYLSRGSDARYSFTISGVGCVSRLFRFLCRVRDSRPDCFVRVSTFAFSRFWFLPTVPTLHYGF